MNVPLSSVHQVHDTTILLVVEGKEFVLAPHDFQTAMTILTAHTMADENNVGSVSIENHKDKYELTNSDKIRKSIREQRTAMIRSGF